MKTKIFIAAVLLAVSATAASEVIFEGTPHTRYILGGDTPQTVNLTPSEASEYKVIISKEGDNYFWTSREDTQVVPITSGIFITYVALSGTGYVRTVMPGLNITQYTEHLLINFTGITYYGK